jgi:GNAT superfamily N-acetyltransferase
MSVDWRIQAIASKHSRTDFRCGEPTLDEYLSRFARQNHNSGVARTFVAVREAEPNRVLGYYSLAAGSIEIEKLPPEAARRFPGFPLPVARLARLAVDSSQQKKGIGAGLMFDAMARCLQAAEDVGIAAVIIDAKDQNAKAFYSQYEFDALPDQELTLWLALPTLRRIFYPKP